MKLKLAVVGPMRLVRDICDVMERHPEAETVPLIYDSERQAPALVSECRELIDYYIFSGPAPYYLSKNSLSSDDKAVYIPFEGTDIYHVLLQIYQFYHFYPVISYDVIDPPFLEEIYEELEIAHTPYYIKTMEGYWDTEELYNHHLRLWKEKKVQVIATCLHSLYERFQLLKIPVFLIKHTKQSIRDAVDKAILIGLEQRRSEAQLAILQFLVDSSDQREWKGDDLMEAKQKIMEHGNRLFSGSALIEGNRITLYTTRGIWNRITHHARDMSLIQDIYSQYRCRVSLGIGMGQTADMAIYNADRALTFAVQNGGNSSFLIDDEKRIHGPLGTEESIQYSLAHLEDSQVSVTLRKFYAWLVMMRKNHVTVRDVSFGMNTSDRHAARILKILCSRGLAEMIGKESMNQKGRPRPVYRIAVADLAEEVQGSNQQSSN